MVLIEPTIERDTTLAYKGLLKVSFPKNSGCESFAIPLEPTPEILEQWKVYVKFRADTQMHVSLRDAPRLPEITIWPTHPPVDGYVCESVSGGRSPSESLSRYFGKPVSLVYKGPRPREIDPTTRAPELKATAKYQDMYPLLILSEESTAAIEAELRGHVGTQGIDASWATGSVAIERYSRVEGP